MDIIRFKSDPPLTAFAPTWDYTMGEDFLNLTDIDLQKIKELIISREKDILENTEISDTDGYTGLGSNSITSRFQSFNILLWPNEICKVIESEILNKYKKFLEILNVKRQPVYIQCWANILRTNESIKPHIHSTDPYTYLGGHICITENDTETCYINPINQLNDPQKLSENENLERQLDEKIKDLKDYNFKMVFKSKMMFRKSFEYIYSKKEEIYNS